jgi:sulfur carrier protein ThiS
MTLLCLAMGATLGLLAGCGALLPEQKAHAPFESADQVAESYDQIVPGMTRADDLAHLGFDTAKVAMLSSRDIAQRLGSADPAVRACIRAEIYCTGFVFHPVTVSGLFQHPGQPGDIVLLVMNGRVIHKVFSGNPVAHGI